MSDTLPTPPAVMLSIIRAAGDPDAKVSTLASYISAHPSMTASVLSIANSAVFHRGESTHTVAKATIVLGTRAIRNLAVTHAVRVMTSHVDAGELDDLQFWEDSLRRATVAMVLARTAGYEDAAEAFTVGLLQDLGTLAMAVQWPEHSLALQEAMGKPAAERLAIERAVTGLTHTQYLAEHGDQWGLPDDMIEVMVLHHDPSATIDDRRRDRLRKICTVADLVADVVQTGAAGRTVLMATEALDRLITREPIQLEQLLDTVAAEMEKLSADLELHIGAQPTYEELMSNANEALIQINVSYEELTRKLQQLLEEKEELTRQLRSSNAALARLAATDMLTGVANRRAFSEATDSALKQAEADGTPLALLMLDIDHFKAVNDTYGHAGGDDVLRGVCDRMQAVVRAEDLVGRLGGEEFAVLLPDCDAYHGKRVAERLRLALKKKPIRTRSGEDIRVTASFGGTTLEQVPLPTRDQVFKIVDEALYEAKESGRDRVVWVE